MDVTLLSGVVRNRKQALAPETKKYSNSENSNNPSQSAVGTIWEYLLGGGLLKNFNLRVHKFIFQWDLVIYLSACIVSLIPFTFTGRYEYSIVPITIWALYNILFLMGARRADSFMPGFGRFKHTVKAAVEEFFSPKLLPVLSISFLLVVLSLTLTAQKLGGPPLCFSSCGQCLSNWQNSIPLPASDLVDRTVSHGCGYENGEELLGYYTMAQTSSTLFVTVIIAMTVCMAWSVADGSLFFMPSYYINPYCLALHHSLNSYDQILIY